MAGNRDDRNAEQEVHLPALERPGPHHEERDVNTWAVGKFAIALVLLCGVALLILAALFKYFAWREAGGPAAPTGVNVDARKLPPEPRLQDTPVLDLKAMKAAEDLILNGYGWVDQQHGIARIPINRAIDLLSQRGLPSRPQAEMTSASTATVPTESALGYIMQQPGGPLAGPASPPPQPLAEPTVGNKPTGTMPGANPPPTKYDLEKK